MNSVVLRYSRLLAAWIVLAFTAKALAGDPRPPRGGIDLRFWLGNMIVDHGYTPAEAGEATGLSAEEIAAFMKGMNDGKFDYQFISYAGAVHAFSNPGADKIAQATGLPIAYHAAADRRSWAHMRSFFNEIFAVKK